MRISDWSSDVCSSDLHVDRDGDPDLRLHRIGRSAEERLDAQVLLDPSEEQLDLPALAIQGADRRGGQGELIGEQHDGLEIGRASCRERVCQYGKISVVAGSLKKKTKKITRTTR